MNWSLLVDMPRRESKMTIEEIQKNLETAYHEIGHAYAYVGDSRFLAAEMACDRARAALNVAADALEKIQD